MIALLAFAVAGQAAEAPRWFRCASVDRSHAGVTFGIGYDPATSAVSVAAGSDGWSRSLTAGSVTYPGSKGLSTVLALEGGGKAYIVTIGKKPHGGIQLAVGLVDSRATGGAIPHSRGVCIASAQEAAPDYLPVLEIRGPGVSTLSKPQWLEGPTWGLRCTLADASGATRRIDLAVDTSRDYKARIRLYRGEWLGKRVPEITAVYLGREDPRGGIDGKRRFTVRSFSTPNESNAFVGTGFDFDYYNEAGEEPALGFSLRSEGSGSAPAYEGAGMCDWAKAEEIEKGGAR